MARAGAALANHFAPFPSVSRAGLVKPIVGYSGDLEVMFFGHRNGCRQGAPLFSEIYFCDNTCVSLRIIGMSVSYLTWYEDGDGPEIVDHRSLPGDCITGLALESRPGFCFPRCERLPAGTQNLRDAEIL